MTEADTGDPVRVTVLEAIRGRRNVREFLDRPVSRAAIERLLEAARWAPNHRLTYPWRFFVLEKGGKARAAVAELTRQWTYDNNARLPEPKRTAASDAMAREILDVPGYMYVYATAGPSEEVTRENYASACIAVQNMLLAAFAEGLSVGWSTGRPTRHAGLPGTLGADPGWQMVGALYIGYPAVVPTATRPEPAEFTVWL